MFQCSEKLAMPLMGVV